MMKLINGTYIPLAERQVAVEVSPNASAVLEGTKFPPAKLATVHLQGNETTVLDALDIKSNVLGGWNVTSFLLAGDLVVWVLSEPEPKKTFVFLPDEYHTIRMIVD